MAIEGFTQYTSRGPVFGDVALPQISGGERTAAAVQGLGSAVGDFADKLAQAQNVTEKAHALTGFMTDADKLSASFDNDTDYKTVNKRFGDGLEQIKQQYLGQVSSPVERAQLETTFTRNAISYGASIRAKALQREGDANAAQLDAQDQPFVNNWMNAGSDASRASIRDTRVASINDAVKSGWITAQNAEARIKAFDTNTQYGAALRDIQTNPATAIGRLNDPAVYPALSPDTRQSLIANSTNQVTQQNTLRAGELAKTDPTAAKALYGSLGASDVGAAFQRFIVPIESRGDTTAVSPTGALGVSQILRSTATEVARGMGQNGSFTPDQRKVYSDFAALPADQQRDKLLKDPAFNASLGQEYLRQQLQRYGGNLFAASLAYNQGPGAADSAVAAAKAKFGDHFTAGQLVSVTPQAEGRSYVLKVAKLAGQDPSMPAPTFAGSYAAAQAVDSQVQANERAQTQIANQQVQLQRPTFDNAIDNLKAGHDIDPGQEASLRQTLTNAATRGNTDAAQQLQQIDYAKMIRPAIDQALRTPPSILENQVADEEARLASKPGGFSALEKQRLDATKTALAAVKAGSENDPVGLAARAGYVTPAPILPGQDFSADGHALGDRADQAARAQSIYGGAYKFLQPSERAAWSAAWQGAQPEQRAALVSQLAAALPRDRDYNAALSEIAPNDSLAQTAGRLARRDPALAGDILRGASLLEQPGVKPKVADVRTALQTKLPSDVYPAEVSGDMIEAALAVYASDKGRSGALFDGSDSAAIGRAVERVTGTMVSIGGKPTPVPYGTPTSDLREGWRVLDQSALDAGGGAVARDGTPFDPQFLSRNASLRPMQAGGGVYGVYLPGAGGRDAPVMTKDGHPLVLTLDQIRGAGKRDAQAIAKRDAEDPRRLVPLLDMQ